MAIKKEDFKKYLRNYYLKYYKNGLREGLDDSMANIPSQIDNLVNAGVPFERALDIIEEATFNNNFDPYRAALQEYRNKGRVYRSPEPNGRDRIDVDKIVRDTLNKPELGSGYYPPPGISTSPNSQHSQYSVIPKHRIIGDMTPIPTEYPYNLGVKDNQDIQDIAPESKLGLPISGMYDESAVSTDTNEPSGKVVVGPDTEVPTQSVQPVAKSPRRATKPRVINNTSTTPVVNTPTTTTTTFNASAPVTAPTLSSVTSQAVRHNGGFDNYRRQSVLSALRAAGGISPAEAVQRGIIPMEALNYI